MYFTYASIHVYAHKFYVYFYIHMGVIKFITWDCSQTFPISHGHPSEPPKPVIVQSPPDFLPVSEFRSVLPHKFLCFCDADAGPGLRTEEGGGRGTPLKKFREFT